MPTIWGVHNDQPQLDLVENRFVSVGWAKMGDLRAIGNDKEAMKARIEREYPEKSPGAVAGNAGTLLSFAFRMQRGDLVIYPHKPDSTLSFGRIDGDYEYHPDVLHQHRRRVTWLQTGIPRTTFSETARYEVGSAVTIFQVRRHMGEFLDFLDGRPAPPAVAAATPEPEEVIETAAETPSAERIETFTRDFVVDTLMTRLEGVDFERFVAHLLSLMGYRTRVTQASGDGGVDVIAHRDPLGIEPPILKVQCKRTTRPMGGPDVQRLTGTLAPGGDERGLFVTLGPYSKDAQHIERTRQDLRLVNGTELVDLVFTHYERLSPEYKRLLPMRSVYVVDGTAADS